jgi:ParB family chromosome partitioning protein
MKLQQIPIDQIVPADKHHVREEWSEEAMESLAAAVKERGLIQPVKVRPTEDPGVYELVAGHRRVEASKRAGLETVPCVVEDVSDTHALLDAFMENTSREDMSPIDIAKALKKIQDETGWSQQEMGRRGIGHQSWIANHIALLQEPDDIQGIIAKGTSGHVEEGKVTERHIRMVRIAVGDDEKARVSLINKAAMETLTSNQVREVADMYVSAPDDETRQAIIETSYHDPAFRQLVSARTGVIRKESAKQKKPVERAVKKYLTALGEFRQAVLAARQPMKEGLFAPEAMAMIRRWHDDIIEKMMELDEIYKET